MKIPAYAPGKARARRRPFRLPRKWNPRDPKIAGVLLYLLALWGLMSLPHKELTAWMSGWLG